MSATDIEHQFVVEAEINYIRNASDPEGAPLEFVTEDETRSTMQTLPGQRVEVRDGRRIATSLDREGFLLVRHVSAVPDFASIEEDPEVDRVYVEEMTDLLRRVTGAKFVLMLGGGKKRFGEAATGQLSGLANARPARYPHADNTDISASDLHAMVTGFLGDQIPQGSRWAMYNMWRAVSPPPQDIPLAVCDATSVSADDEVTVTAVTTTRDSDDLRHDTTGYRYNPAHRWHYYPNMAVDEVIVFKAHDSDPDRSRRVPHSAFTDPSCPTGTPTRASVEARGLAVFT